MQNNFKRILYRTYRKGVGILKKILCIFPFYKCIYETRNTQTPVKISNFITQKILRINSRAYWPMHFTSKVNRVDNILIGIETCPGYMPNCYIQAESPIVIGDYTQIGPGVGLISSNHNPLNNRINLDNGGIYIGEYCWLGMNSIILPGVKLGDFTIVGAGAIVTKSFEDGYCIIAGSPAVIIKKLNKEECIRHKSEKEYVGFFTKNKFENSVKGKLKVTKYG